MYAVQVFIVEVADIFMYAQTHEGRSPSWATPAMGTTFYSKE
jgi:hypothetical protein